jgi:hypothetical protein
MCHITRTCSALAHQKPQSMSKHHVYEWGCKDDSLTSMLAGAMTIFMEGYFRQDT